jgi:hypothetical protein
MFRTFYSVQYVDGDMPFSKSFITNLYMDPAFAATTACHAMHQLNTGLRLYIRPLDGQPMCPGLDEIRARSPH